MTAPNILTTEDGYMYTQLPSGWYTDGDVEFDANNTDIYGLVWEAFPHFDGGVIYCADGDGFVTVQPTDDGFIVAVDQGDAVGKFGSLREALMAAQHILATDYPGIYETSVQ